MENFAEMLKSLNQFSGAAHLNWLMYSHNTFERRPTEISSRTNDFKQYFKLIRSKLPTFNFRY